MKKTFYILAAAAMMVAACTKELEGPSEEQTKAPEGEMVTLTFSASFPDTPLPTKGAMGEVPVIDNMYVAVFGISGNALGGNLQHWAPATFVAVEGSGETYKAKYEVTLPLSDEGRVIHYIANYPGSEPPTFDREKTVLDRMYTTGTDGAYWQAVTLPEGIRGTLKEGTTNEYVLDSETEAKLDNIALVRNYAKISVEQTAETDEFEILSYTLINVPERGSLAPYSSADKFNTVYTGIGAYNSDSDKDLYEDLTKADYLGYMPTEDIVTDNPGESSMKAPSDADGFYMYERTVPTKSNTQTAVIALLKWRDDLSSDSPNYELHGKQYYYKIELLNSDGAYVPILRNIHYKVKLAGLTGDGEQSYAAAFAGPYFGDVSASIETATLNEISDQVSKLVVSRMDYTAVSSGETVDIYFQYYPEISGAAVTTVGGDDGLTLTTRTVSGYSQSIASVSTPTTATWNGGTWGKVTVTLNSVPASGMLRGALRVQGNKEGKRKLYRDIIFTVMSKQTFSSATKVSSLSSDSKGQTVTLNIGLPEGLPYSIFPVQVKIEAQGMNLTTTDSNLPVSFGPSAFDSSKNSYYFIRTISYSEYFYKNSSGDYVYNTDGYSCTLQTTKDSGNATTISLKDVGGYFNETRLTLQ